MHPAPEEPSLNVALVMSGRTSVAIDACNGETCGPKMRTRDEANVREEPGATMRTWRPLASHGSKEDPDAARVPP
jgi:hypothetical protein